MNILSDIFYKSLAKNEENLRFWENYLQNLRSLDFSVYADKLKVPALVPVGSKVFFRGVLKHTNEVTIALGADYFVKCSLSQAEVLRQHRIKDAEYKVEALQKERDYIQNQVQFGAENVLNNQGQEIMEEFTVEEDLKWREKHKANMRLYKQRSKHEEPKEEADDSDDEDLWSRLDELELQEELEEEMAKSDNVTTIKPAEQNINKLKREHVDSQDYNHTSTDENEVSKHDNSKTKERPLSRNVEIRNSKITKEESNKNNHNLELLQQVIDRQNELKEKLTDLKNKETAPSQTENDLLSRLDKMEQLEDLEDEMDRLDDILQTEEVEEAEESEEEQKLKLPAVKIKRCVSFVDEDDSETLELKFSHSETGADRTPYDKERGITKPSDIYAAFSNLFTETTSILKKSKYESDLSSCEPKFEKRIKVDDFQEAEDNRQRNKTIVVNDVVEKVDENDNTFESGDKRPISLFKKRRQQNLK